MSAGGEWGYGRRFFGRMRDDEEDSPESGQIDNEQCLETLKATAKMLLRQNRKYKARNVWLRKAVQGYTGQEGVHELYPKELLYHSHYKIWDFSCSTGPNSDSGSRISPISPISPNG
jgi:hypothetical protein